MARMIISVTNYFVLVDNLFSLNCLTDLSLGDCRQLDEAGLAVFLHTTRNSLRQGISESVLKHLYNVARRRFVRTAALQLDQLFCICILFGNFVILLDNFKFQMARLYWSHLQVIWTFCCATFSRWGAHYWIYVLKIDKRVKKCAKL